MKIIKFEKENQQLEIRATVLIEKAEWDKILHNTRTNIAKTLKVKGFREGKFPVHLVDEKVGSNNVLSRAERNGQIQCLRFLNSEKKEDLQLYRAFRQTTDKVSFEELQVSFNFQKMPTIKLGSYENVKVPIPPIEITSQDINHKLKEWKNQHAEFVEKKGKTAKLGDYVRFDFIGRMNGKEFEGGSAKNYRLKLGNQQFIPGFETGLVGTKANETKVLSLVFPANYKPEFANQPVEFTVNVIAVEDKKNLETDEELLAKMKSATIKNVKDLKKHCQNEIKEKKEREQKQATLRAIKAKILLDSVVEIPKAYLETEFQRIKQEQKNRILSQGQKFEDFLKSRKQTEIEYEQELKKTTESLIKEYLLTHKIAEAAQIKVEKKEIDDYYKFLSGIMKKSVAEVKKTHPEISLYSHFLRYKVDQFLLTGKKNSEKNS